MKIKLFITALLLAVTMAFIGCGTPSVDSSSSSSSTKDSSSSVVDDSSSSTPDSSSADDRLISIDAEQDVITLYDEDVADFDFTTLFTIYADSDVLPVEREYLTSTVKAQEGEYEVTCSLKDQSLTVKVIVVSSNYSITLLKDSVTLNLALVDSYDFKGLFTLTKDGKPVEIADNMIDSTVKAEIGVYSYTVSVFNESKTLTVTVTDAHEIEIYPAFTAFTIAESQLSSFDYASLFIVYSDKKVMEITDGMLDLSALEGATEGVVADVVLNFVHDSSSMTSSVEVTVVADPEIKVTARNVIAYPNGEFIDLVSLFEIKKGDESIPVTLDMISGSIDYHKIGDSIITLTFEGQTYDAVVTVRRGAFVSVAKSDVVVIQKGTRKLSYDFAGDFEVVVNGIKYTAFNNYFVGLENVNFDVEGVYPLTLKIPYSNTPPSLSGPNFSYVEATVNYVVKANVADVRLNLDPMVFVSGKDGEFDPFSNVTLFVNGKEKGLTDNPDYATSITAYAKVISDPIDLTKTGLYTVRLAIYVDGANNEPLEVSYDVEVVGDVVVDCSDVVVFEGETIYPTDLFSLTVSGEEVEVTSSMISGALNLYKPGKYVLTLTYGNVSRSLSVTVFDSDLKGTYSTFMRTLEQKEDTDEEGFPIGGVASVRYDDLIIENAESIKFGNKVFEVVSTVDENTLVIATVGVSKNYYTLHYDRGIVVLDPINSINMGFSDYFRPLVFFNESVWTVSQNYFQVNKYSAYVLANNNVTYSIDVGKVTSVKGNETLWYGLKVSLDDRTSSSSYYSVSWGELEMDPDFAQRVEYSTYFVLNGENYSFTFDASDRRVAKISTESVGNPYSGTTFRATIDGKSAALDVLLDGTFRYRENNVSLVEYGISDLSDNPGSGLDLSDNTVLLYSFYPRAIATDGELYSYKFLLHPETKTFELLEKDIAYGQYSNSNAYIFLDGYGSGLVSFDTSSYYKYEIDYVLSGQYVSYKVKNVKSNFAYDREGVLFLDDLGNVLTAKKFGDPSFEDSQLVTMIITDGAVVTVKSLEISIGANTTETKKSFFDNIEIVTKEGVLEGSQKESLIKTNTVSFTVPGFYQFSITVPVNGVDVVSYYSIQIIDDLYEGNGIVGIYEGVVKTAYSLTVDKYGFATLTDRSLKEKTLTYRGNATISGNELGATLYGEEGSKISLHGVLLDSGLISISCSGSITLKDYFSQKGSSVTGCEGISLRRILVGETYRYYLSSVSTSIGEEVTLVSKNGLDLGESGVIAIATKQNGSTLSFRIDSWGTVGSGLIPIDKVAGDYVLNATTLSLDGFGNLTLNGVKGVYEICTSNQIYVDLVSEYTIIILAQDGTFAYSDVALDETLLYGKVYSATYNAGDMSNMYSTTTSFTFSNDGRVLIKSESEEYAENAFAPYSPLFTGWADYEVNGKILTVTLSNEEGEPLYSFTFEIVNVVTLYNLKLISTDLSSEADGYFAPNTLFV